MHAPNAALAAIAADRTLLDERRFVERHEALQALAWLDEGAALRAELEAVDGRLFRRLRAAVRGGLRGAALLRALDALVPAAARAGLDAPGYDALDALIDGLLAAAPPPAAAAPREAEMVGYQPTPARVLLALLREARPSADDRIVDLGAGLGRLPLLAALLGEAAALGVEIEPAYVAHARACAAALGAARAQFVAADARSADLAGGTIFYLYTPFTGAVLGAVLARLRALALRRPIRLFCYGPCTAVVAQEPWLWRARGGEHPHSIGAFCSR